MASPDFDAVLKRFDEVASAQYPFQQPEKEKIQGQRLSLTSKKNLVPLVRSGLSLLLSLCSPILFLCCLACTATMWSRPWMGYFFGTGTIVFFLNLSRNVFFLHWLTDGHSGLGGSDARDGIFCKNTARNTRISERLRRFVKYRPTPYLCSGDLLTLIPFLFFKGSVGGRVNYRRWWVRVPSAKAPDGLNGPSKKPGADDDEAVALDVSFPPDGHRADRPAFLVLHGLNGGSTEPYILDLVRRANKEGSTVAVMIGRGLSKTPVRGAESFTGARTSDVACAVDALLYGLGAERRSSVPPTKTQLVLVGFSMGGIVAANYTAKSQAESGLAGTVCFSGTLCSEKMLLPVRSAQHSLSLWQPALAWGLKSTIVKPNLAQLTKRGITVNEVEEIKTVIDIDTKLVCKYHGYAAVQDYYEDMSAGGRGDAAGFARLANTKTPLLVVHAIDDPIAIYEVTLADKIANTENVILLATKHGGHIGWPQGWLPSKKRWSYMVDLAMEYASVLADERLC